MYRLGRKRTRTKLAPSSISGRHLLTDDLSLWIDAEKDPAAAMVQHGAKRVHRLPAFAGGLLELQGLRLALRDQSR
jgi:hypothetical protein